MTDGEILLNGENIAKWTPDDSRARRDIPRLSVSRGHQPASPWCSSCARPSPRERVSTNSASRSTTWTSPNGWTDSGWTRPSRASPERRLLRWRAQAQRSPPDGTVGAGRSRSSTRPTPDSDIDALACRGQGCAHRARRTPETWASIVVTHYVKLLEEIEPDQVHILVDGQIVHSGDAQLAQQIELDGYDAWRPVTT
jgi:hypothetical protein